MIFRLWRDLLPGQMGDYIDGFSGGQLPPKNAIREIRHFQGWVEKRGLRFLASWDDRYIPILSTHDQGQKPQAGG